VVAGDKELLELRDVVKRRVPFYEEFSLANFYNQIQHDPQVLKHLPDPNMSKK
jgi:hypothetical protein